MMDWSVFAHRADGSSSPVESTGLMGKELMRADLKNLAPFLLQLSPGRDRGGQAPS